MANNKVASGDTILAARMNATTFGTTAPSSPTTGWVWVDTTTAHPIVKVWNGSAWEVASGSAFTTIGQLPYASAVGVQSQLGIGSTGQVLTVVGGVPAWANPVTAGVGNLSGATVTMTTAGTYYDSAGASALFAAGTYLFTAQALFVNSVVANASHTLALRDSLNNLIAGASQGAQQAVLGIPYVVNWTYVVAPGSTTTYKLSGVGGSNSSILLSSGLTYVKLT